MPWTWRSSSSAAFVSAPPSAARCCCSSWAAAASSAALRAGRRCWGAWRPVENSLGKDNDQRCHGAGNAGTEDSWWWWWWWWKSSRLSSFLWNISSYHALFRLIASRLLRDFDVKLGLMFSLQGWLRIKGCSVQNDSHLKWHPFFQQPKDLWLRGWLHAQIPTVYRICPVQRLQFQGIILRPTSWGMEVVTTSLLIYAMFKVVWDTWISKLHGFFLLWNQLTKTLEHLQTSNTMEFPNFIF